MDPLWPREAGAARGKRHDFGMTNVTSTLSARVLGASPALGSTRIGLVRHSVLGGTAAADAVKLGPLLAQMALRAWPTATWRRQQAA